MSHQANATPAATSPTIVAVPNITSRPWTIVEGGVVRGDASRRELALIFTGGDFGEGTGHVLDTLAAERVVASIFVTGDYLRKPEHLPHLRRAIVEGHYVGPHSDAHPLYAPWEDRSRNLVTEEFFKADLLKNVADLRALGALRDASRPVYFIPPYEWYNATHARWAKDVGALLFNFTPGSGSNRDWAPEGHRSFVPSRQIIDDILACERTDPHGLNGFLLLLHVGSERTDKTFLLLDELLHELKGRGYAFKRVDELLDVR